jgi:hypothetical protein
MKISDLPFKKMKTQLNINRIKTQAYSFLFLVSS